MPEFSSTSNIPILKQIKSPGIKLICFAFAIFFLFQSVLYSQTRNLKFYIDNAIKTSPVINENKLLLTTHNIRKELVRSGVSRPRLFTTANYLFAPTFGEFGYDSAVTNGGLYSALLNFELPLFTGYTSDSKLEDIANEQNIFTNNIIATEHEISKNVTEQYIKTYQDKEQINSANDVLNILDLQREIVKKLVDRSLAKISDLTLLDIEYQTQVINKKQFDINYERDLMELNLLAGIRDTAIVELEPPGIKLTEDASTKSYFLKSYILDSLKLSTEKKLNESNYKPQLTFFVNGGLNAVSYNEMWKKFGVSTGVNFIFSLYDGNQKDLNNQLINIKTENISYQKNYFIYQNETRKKNILKELKNQESLLAEMEKQLVNYETLLTLYRNQFAAGEVSMIDYINILKGYISYKNEIILNRNQQLTIINEYNYWNW